MIDFRLQNKQLLSYGSLFPRMGNLFFKYICSHGNILFWRNWFGLETETWYKVRLLIWGSLSLKLNARN